MLARPRPPDSRLEELVAYIYSVYREASMFFLFSLLFCKLPVVTGRALHFRASGKRDFKRFPGVCNQRFSHWRQSFLLFLFLLSMISLVSHTHTYGTA